MPKTSKVNPIRLEVSINQEMEDALKALASRRKLSVADLSRRLLSQGINRDAAHDATATIEAMVRRVVRKEIVTTHDLAFRAAFNAIAATSMVRSLWLNPTSTWPLSASEADSLWGEIRKDTAGMLRKEFKLPLPDDNGEDEEEEM